MSGMPGTVLHSPPAYSRIGLSFLFDKALSRVSTPFSPVSHAPQPRSMLGLGGSFIKRKTLPSPSLAPGLEQPVHTFIAFGTR